MAVAVSRLKAQAVAGAGGNSSERPAASEDGQERQGEVNAAEGSGRTRTAKRKSGQKRKAHGSAAGDDVEMMDGEAVAGSGDDDDEFVDIGSSRKATRGRKRGKRGGGA